MLLQLPTELTAYIIRTAVHEYRFSDRQSVVSLASSSRVVYEIVGPILYHTIIVTDSNVDQLESLASNSRTHQLAKRIFSHVRSFHNFSTKGYPIDARLLVNIESIESHELMPLFLLTKLKSVHIPILDIGPEVPGQIGPAGVFAAVTHVIGTLPMFSYVDYWDSFFGDPASWMRSLLEYLPAVTHLGLEYDYPWRDEGAGVIARFDCVAVGTAVRTALSDCPNIQCLVIRTCGLLAETRQTDFEVALRDVGDSRVKIWVDMRRMADWHDYRALRILDVKEGRTIWTEARSL